MKKFSFNLQRLLDYRETVENALLAELGALRARREREKVRLAEMVAGREHLVKNMKKQLCGGDPDTIRRTYEYLRQVTEDVVAQKLKIREIDAMVDRKTSEVVEAAKERKAMERLREYKVAEHRKETEQQEQKFLDDIAGIHHSGATRAA